MMLANRPLPAQTMEMDGIGFDHPNHQYAQHPHQLGMQRTGRKRKADSLPENNERLSKRMSLLNLEQGGNKLYVPVENPPVQSAFTSPSPSLHSHRRLVAPENDSSPMQLDDSKYKVYIYNLEDELSSGESDAESTDGKLIFLPDIEKHLAANRRIPPHILAARPDVTDMVGKELVLYSVPSSITVPEEQDSVRKAIIEARARLREKQKEEREKPYTQALAPRLPATTSLPSFQNPLAPPLSMYPGTVPDSSPLVSVGDADAMEL
ncbi:hypothetical protein QBC46DRAFT_372228, partial [Diplogelasinospora grovesii]